VISAKIFPLFTCHYVSHRNNTHVITLQILLTSWEKQYDVFEVKVLPSLLHDGSEHVTLLQNPRDGIALHEEPEFYYTLDKHELREIGTHHVSHPVKIFNLVKNKSCIMAIFNNRNADIDSLCKYAIVTNTL